MSIKYPLGCDTPDQQILYILRSIEALKLIHNTMGKWSNEGLQQDEYDDGVDAGELNGRTGETVPLTDHLKSTYSYKSETLSKEDFEEFKETYFRPRQSELFAELASLRGKLGYDKSFQLDLDNVVVKAKVK